MFSLHDTRAAPYPPQSPPTATVFKRIHTQARRYRQLLWSNNDREALCPNKDLVFVPVFYPSTPSASEDVLRKRA